ncbi:MAG: ribonuclease P protein component [Bacteroidales bacterium]|jgi:ribonuclease P protein component|nr:ribonuclease P protein component [Bacteroidales bacterium]MDD4215689.1 ribonuclease P protein component [Bacteroidales bacterium]
MHSFCKEERLCSKKSIEKLLSEGKKIYYPTFTVKWMEVFGENIPEIQLLTVVPKKKFKKSTNRNLIKRLIREAYRNNKQILDVTLKEKNKKIALMLLYKGEIIETYKQTEEKIIIILQGIMKCINHTP